jgi:murein DD-endopeptidase MepM/ murein hydrolase activator NlpD
VAYFRLILGNRREPRAGITPRKAKYNSFKTARTAATLISLLLISGTLLPATARASVFESIIKTLKGEVTAQADTTTGSVSGNLQTASFARPARNIDPSPATGGGDITIVDNSALMPEEGPSGTIADIVKPKVSTISTYIVQSGDTLSGIAKMFGVSTGTILSANNLSSGSKLKVGERLVILPITGINYTVKKGDTLAAIAKRYGGDISEIQNYNGIDDSTLAVGASIIIPNGEVPATATKSTSTKVSATVRSSASGVFANNPAEPAHNVGAPGSVSQVGYYISPLSHYVRTQGIHGYNGVDLAAPTGTPIRAAADGTVVIAKAGGWNGGYGSYVVISHGNGSQTLYAHMSKVAAYDGESVSQGDIIGYVGSTGESTGSHVHFEIRNGIRNPF